MTHWEPWPLAHHLGGENESTFQSLMSGHFLEQSAMSPQWAAGSPGGQSLPGRCGLGVQTPLAMAEVLVKSSVAASCSCAVWHTPGAAGPLIHAVLGAPKLQFPVQWVGPKLNKTEVCLAFLARGEGPDVSRGSDGVWWPCRPR